MYQVSNFTDNDDVKIIDGDEALSRSSNTSGT